MKTKPRAIGTNAETAIVKKLREYWPTADRSPLRGNRDQGDIRGTGEFIWEAKAGNAAREVHAELLTKWMLQTEVERVNAGVRFGVLVTTRLGYGPARADRWWAWIPTSAFAELLGGEHRAGGLEDAPIRVELGALLRILADHGYTPDIEPVVAASEGALIG